MSGLLFAFALRRLLFERGVVSGDASVELQLSNVAKRCFVGCAVVFLAI